MTFHETDQQNPARLPRSSSSPEDFTQLARKGRTSWKRHLAAAVTILFGFVVLGAAAAMVAVALLPDALDPDAPAGVTRTASGYLVQNISFPFLLISVLVAVRFIHRRPLRTLFTAFPKVRVRRILLGFAVYFGVYVASALIAALIDPTDFRMVFDPAGWLMTLPLILVLTTIQTTSEEVLFRGYLLQTAGLFFRRTWVHSIVGGVLFTLPHLLNPEVATSPIVIAFYFTVGALFTLIAIHDGGLELVLGAHAANNLFAALIVTQASGSLATVGIWEVVALDPVYAFLSMVVGGAVFYLLLVRRPRRERPGDGFASR